MTGHFIRGGAIALLALGILPAAAQEQFPERAVRVLPEPAQPASLPPAKGHPFATLSGSWTGSGTMDMTNEIHEKIRCRASYNYGQPNNSLALSIRCASDNYKFELSSNVVERGGAISGTWKEEAYNVSGSINGQVSGNRITATARGDSFTAALAVNTAGNQQSVTITPQATYILGVHINMNRTMTASAGGPAPGKKK